MRIGKNQTAIKFLKKSITYLLGSVASKLVNLVLIPIQTKNIPPSEYGQFDYDITWVSLLVSILYLDIGSTMFKFMKEEKTQFGIASVIKTSGLIFFFSSLLFIPCCFTLDCLIDFQTLCGMLVYGLVSSFVSVLGYLSRGMERNKSFVVSGILNSFVTAGTSLFFMLVLHWGYKALLLSSIIGVLCQCVILCIACRQSVKLSEGCINKTRIVTMISFAIPLCVNSVAYWLLNGVNRITVSTILSVEQNGFYSVASKFSTIITLFSSCFLLAWQEYSFDHYERTDKNFRTYEISILLLISVVLVACLVMIPIIELGFPLIINSQYYPAITLVPFLMAGTGLYAFSSFLSSILSTYKLTKEITLSTLTGCILNLIILLFFIKKMGAIAATISYAIGYFANDLCKLIFLNKKTQIKVNFSSYIGLCLILVCFCTACLLLDKYWHLLLLGCLLSVGVAFLTYKRLKQDHTNLFKPNSI